MRGFERRIENTMWIFHEVSSLMILDSDWPLSSSSASRSETVLFLLLRTLLRLMLDVDSDVRIETEDISEEDTLMVDTGKSKPELANSDNWLKWLVYIHLRFTLERMSIRLQSKEWGTLRPSPRLITLWANTSIDNFVLKCGCKTYVSQYWGFAKIRLQKNLQKFANELQSF